MHAYIWQRIKELADDKNLLQYKWDGGSADMYDCVTTADKLYEPPVVSFSTHRPAQQPGAAPDGQRIWSADGRYASTCVCVHTHKLHTHTYIYKTMFLPDGQKFWSAYGSQCPCMHVCVCTAPYLYSTCTVWHNRHLHTHILKCMHAFAYTHTNMHACIRTQDQNDMAATRAGTRRHSHYFSTSVTYRCGAAYAHILHGVCVCVYTCTCCSHMWGTLKKTGYHVLACTHASWKK